MVAGLEVVVLVGLPGAGKSTFYRERFAPTHALVSKDLYPRSAPNKARRQARDLARALDAGRSVVVDNTSVSAAQRAPIVAAARGASARLVGYVLDGTVDECRRRNAGRAGDACVPDVAILSARQQLQWPSLAEGFDELWRVTLVDGQGFVVSAWQERA